MAEEAQDSDKAQDIQSQIKAAIMSRGSYFHEQADSLTFEGVRRLLEKDLGLETHALDAHKRFVKQWLETCIESANTDNLPKSQGDDVEKAMSSSETEAGRLDGVQTKKEAEDPNSGGGEVMDDSPVMGLMTGPKKVKRHIDEVKDTKNEAVPSESTIKKAVWARASYLRENTHNLTLAGLRRLLEEDLELDKHALDPFKKFINEQVDEVLQSPEVPETTGSDKKVGKDSSKSTKEEPPASSGSESEEVEKDEVKVKKKRAPREKLLKAEAVKKRKRAEESTKGARRKESKVSKPKSEASCEEDGGDISEDGSSEKPVKKKEVPKPSYGKQVEHLKSVIKTCGLSISPAVYKKVKQAPEDKREACLIKELKEILAKEGLSSNPSEKEIKDVKKRKERARELEGIDLSNIVSSSRRRSTTSFAPPPPKPKTPDESEPENGENEDEEDEDDEDDEEEEEEVDEDQENGGNGSQSQESEEDNGSDSD